MRDEHGQLKTDAQRNPVYSGNADHDYGSSVSIKFQSSKYSQQLTVAEYFQQEHGVTLTHPQSMVVNFGSDAKPIWIPAELGIVEPEQRY